MRNLLIATISFLILISMATAKETLTIPNGHWELRVYSDTHPFVEMDFFTYTCPNNPSKIYTIYSEVGERVASTDAFTIDSDGIITWKYVLRNWINFYKFNLRNEEDPNEFYGTSIYTSQCGTHLFIQEANMRLKSTEYPARIMDMISSLESYSCFEN